MDKNGWTEISGCPLITNDDGNVGQRPFEMGYKAVYIMKDIAEGKTVDDPIYTGLDVCDNDNHASCLAL